jgi:hypothetical protein
MAFLEHLEQLIFAASLHQIIGYFYFLGILIYIFSISLKHGKDFMVAIKGANDKFEMPEIIVMFVTIVYINILLSATFLGISPPSEVFFSIDAVILFALTGRVVMNKFSSDKELKERDQTVEDLKSSVMIPKERQEKINILLGKTNLTQGELSKFSDVELDKMIEESTNTDENEELS